MKKKDERSFCIFIRFFHILLSGDDTMINTTKPYLYPEELPERERKPKRGEVYDETPNSEKAEVKPDEAYTPQGEDLDLIIT